MESAPLTQEDFESMADTIAVVAFTRYQEDPHGSALEIFDRLSTYDGPLQSPDLHKERAITSATACLFYLAERYAREMRLQGISG